MIRHMVHLRFQPGISAAAKAALYHDLEALRGHLDGVLDFQTRANCSPETLVTHGFSDLFWFDFADAAARDAYLADAQHRAVGARLVSAVQSGLEGIFVCDFEL